MEKTLDIISLDPKDLSSSILIAFGKHVVSIARYMQHMYLILLYLLT